VGNGYEISHRIVHYRYNKVPISLDSVRIQKSPSIYKLQLKKHTMLYHDISWAKRTHQCWRNTPSTRAAANTSSQAQLLRPSSSPRHLLRQNWLVRSQVYCHKSWNQRHVEVTKNKFTAGNFFHHPGRKLGHLEVEGSRGIPRPDQQTGSYIRESWINKGTLGIYHLVLQFARGNEGQNGKHPLSLPFSLGGSLFRV